MMIILRLWWSSSGYKDHPQAMMIIIVMLWWPNWPPSRESNDDHDECDDLMMIEAKCILKTDPHPKRPSPAQGQVEDWQSVDLKVWNQQKGKQSWSTSVPTGCFFLTVPPNFQHQNEKQWAASQGFCSVKFLMYERSSLVEQRFSV